MQDDWHNAVMTDDASRLAGLIAAGADVDQRDRYGQTGLMLAAAHGRGAVVDLLLQHGADLDATAKHGLSALMLAVLYRHADIARALVDAGADMHLRGSGAPGFAGKTAADLAAQQGLAEIAAFLVRNGG